MQVYELGVERNQSLICKNKKRKKNRSTQTHWMLQVNWPTCRNIQQNAKLEKQEHICHTYTQTKRYLDLGLGEGQGVNIGGREPAFAAMARAAPPTVVRGLENSDVVAPVEGQVRVLVALVRVQRNVHCPHRRGSWGGGLRLGKGGRRCHVSL